MTETTPCFLKCGEAAYEMDNIFNEMICKACAKAVRYGARWGMGALLSETASLNYFHTSWLMRLCDHVDKPPCDDCKDVY